MATRYGNTSYSNYSVTLFDGNSPDKTRMHIPAFSTDEKAFLAFFKLMISGEARQWDYLRKVWFVDTDVLDKFLAGFERIQQAGQMRSIKITDKRTFIQPETFEDFFSGAQPLTQSPKTRDDVLKTFTALIEKEASIPIIIPIKEMTLGNLKPIYRRAALALHPDRNNGDGSKMSSLNATWAELQKML